MWKILISSILLSLILVSCESCEAEAYEPKMAKATWEYQNDYDQGVKGFILYHWGGPEESYDMSEPADSIRWSISNMDSIAFIPYSFASGDTAFIYDQFPVRDAYTRAGIVAIDTLGNTSGMTLSDFVAYWDFYGPEQPINLRIIK